MRCVRMHPTTCGSPRRRRCHEVDLDDQHDPIRKPHHAGFCRHRKDVSAFQSLPGAGRRWRSGRSYSGHHVHPQGGGRDSRPRADSRGRSGAKRRQAGGTDGTRQNRRRQRRRLPRAAQIAHLELASPAGLHARQLLRPIRHQLCAGVGPAAVVANRRRVGRRRRAQRGDQRSVAKRRDRRGDPANALAQQGRGDPQRRRANRQPRRRAVRSLSANSGGGLGHARPRQTAEGRRTGRGRRDAPVHRPVGREVTREGPRRRPAADRGGRLGKVYRHGYRRQAGRRRKRFQPQANLRRAGRCLSPATRPRQSAAYRPARRSYRRGQGAVAEIS